MHQLNLVVDSVEDFMVVAVLEVEVAVVEAEVVVEGEVESQRRKEKITISY